MSALPNGLEVERRVLRRSCAALPPQGPSFAKATARQARRPTFQPFLNQALTDPAHLLETPGQIDILHGHFIACIMAGQPNDYFVINIRPIRVMIHLFGFKSGAKHERDSLPKAAKLEDFSQPISFMGPTRELC